MGNSHLLTKKPLVIEKYEKYNIFFLKLKFEYCIYIIIQERTLPMVVTRSQKDKKTVAKTYHKRSKMVSDSDSSSDESLPYDENDISECDSSSDISECDISSDNKRNILKKCKRIKQKLNGLKKKINLTGENVKLTNNKIQSAKQDINLRERNTNTKSSILLEQSLGKKLRSNNLSIDIKQPTIPLTRSRRRKRKKPSYKDDSDASDIDLDECSSADDEDYTETDAYKNFVESVVENMVEDSYEEVIRKKADMRTKRWKKDLSKREIKKYENEYNTICEKISEMPTIHQILQTEMPFKTKCELMEKLIILQNAQPETFDHLHLKNSINDELSKYKKTSLKNYSQFDDIEKQLDNFDGNMDIPIKYKILDSGISFENKVAVYRRFKNLTNLDEHSSEHPKILNWITTVLNLPTTFNSFPVSIKDNNHTIAKFLYDVKYKLNQEVYGMETVKEQILCILNNKLTNPNLTGSAIGLAGAQGCGKTKLIQVLSKSINIPFTSIPLGGATDSGHLLGHGFTYEGSRPGSIVDALISMKSLSGVIFFDEIDKISTTRYGEEISKALLHITDFTQNHEFVDKYLGNDIKINLSNMWFIYSLNYVELIDKTLADRIPIIQIEGYSVKQKLEMAKMHLIPDAIKNVHLKQNDISFSDDALNYIITETNKMYSSETKDKNGNSGVRKLKDVISNTITKINFLKNTILEDGTYGDLKISFAIPDFKLPFLVERKHIDILKAISNTEISSSSIDMYL